MAPPIAKVATMTWPTSMPDSAAASRSSAMARIALPSRVRQTTASRPASIRIAAMKAMICGSGMARLPSWTAWSIQPKLG